MPNLVQPSQSVRTHFVASVPLDLLNAMYFTFLASQLEGVGDWPAQTRARLDPSLRAELDLLFTYPRREPGILGALNDVLFTRYDEITTVDGLLDFIRRLPADGTESPASPGIQGLALYSLRWPGLRPYRLPDGVAPRTALERALDQDVDADLSCVMVEDVAGGRDAVLALFDDPEDVRARMLRVVRRFYDEHYRADEARRLACMRRSVARHEHEHAADIDEVLRFLTGRRDSCLQELPERYSEFVFVPSVDVGVYNSCADLPPVHGLHYPCEPEFMDEGASADTQRLALVYRALGDEGRLRILRALRDGELYAQQVVQRTGLHQSVVSRHLSFMKAVGLVNVRRQENMKFFSLNPSMGDELRRAVDALIPAPARTPAASTNGARTRRTARRERP